MVQEPYEGEKYPSVDDISPSHPNPNEQYRKREPKSPSFKTEQHNPTQSSQPSTAPKRSQNLSVHHTAGEMNDFVKQLAGKCSEQAKKLVMLESYKGLCERRIRELVPNHPLPVESSHLGNRISLFCSLNFRRLCKCPNSRTSKGSKSKGRRNSSASKRFQVSVLKK